MPSANVVQTSVSGGQQNALALQGDGVFLPKLSTATRTALTLGTSDKGFLAYDTTDNNVYIWNGAAWESVPASGDSSNTQVIFNDNGILAGDAGLTYDKATDSLTVGGNLTLSAGTALGVGYLNASKVLTAGSALIFDGTNLGIGGTGQLRFATSGGAIGDNYIGTENSFSMKLHCGRGSTSSIELASDKLLFYTSAAERMRISAAGDVSIATGNLAFSNGKGIDFSATPQPAGATSELLNDYEEGTFTPTIVGTTAAGVGTYTTQVGRYTKVGDLVTIQIYLDWTAHTGTGNMNIGALPFGFVNAAGVHSGASFGYVNGIAMTAGNILTGYGAPANNFITLNQTPTGGGASNTVPIDVAGSIIVTMTYKT